MKIISGGLFGCAVDGSTSGLTLLRLGVKVSLGDLAGLVPAPKLQYDERCSPSLQELKSIQ